LPTKEDKERLLLDWREQNWHELDESLKVAKGIRDDIKASSKDRLDAIRTIAKMFGALATLKPEAPRVKMQTEVDLSHHESERIRDVLREPIRPG
jgi:hypothetical protein